MSTRVILRSLELRRVVLKAGSRIYPTSVSAAAAAATRREFGAQASALAHQPTTPFWRQQSHVRYGGLAVAALAGSVSLLILLRLEGVQDVVSTLHKRTSSSKKIEDFYTLESSETLGHGQFGTVSTAVDKVTGEVVAVKCVPRSNASEAHFKEEIEAHRDAGGHPNVVGLKGVYADKDYWYMVMERAQGGELYDRLTTEGVTLDDQQVRTVLRETADAMAYMHDRGIVHGDIKPENMLLSVPLPLSNAGGGGMTAARGEVEAAAALGKGESVDILRHQGAKNQSSVGVSGRAERGGVEIEEMHAGVGARARAEDFGKVLLADFGSSFRVKKDAGGGRRVVKEYTAAYSAPEVVKNDPAVNEKADVWSLGVIAYVMVMGYHPFDPSSDSDDDEITVSILTSEPDWDGLEPQAAQLIRQMLARDPADRPSAREVLQSPWLQLSSHHQ